jgi:hypothetical protein
VRLTTPRSLGRACAFTGVAALLAAAPVFAAGPTATGPSSSQSPYLLPSADGVRVTSLLTVGDTVGGYALAGIPDGIGLLGGEDGFRLLLNHEIQAPLGGSHPSGATAGAFVSDWTFGEDLQATSGKDLTRSMQFWNGSTWEVRTGADANVSRFCSADLPAKGAFWDPRSKTGYNGRIFMNGEEVGNEGRAFGHVATGPEKGKSYELPALGNTSFENVIANPTTGRRTVLIALDDSTPGQVYVYVGTKQRQGNAVQRAGLTNGNLFGIAVDGAPIESRTTGVGATARGFSLSPLGDVTGRTGAEIQAASTAAGVTEFLRPEDGAWDPTHPNDFYFVTTDRFQTASTEGNSRLWRLRFKDVDRPDLGGTIENLVDGTEANGPQMMDNLTVDRTGHIVIQEDPGNQAYLAKVWSYDIAADTLTQIAQVDPARFITGAAGFLTQDEETSGITDASRVLGPGWFIGTVQAHYEIPGSPLVEGGQLFALYNPASDPRRTARH